VPLIQTALPHNRPAFRQQKPRLLLARPHPFQARSLQAPQTTFSPSKCAYKKRAERRGAQLF
jgi:hypothetical protein